MRRVWGIATALTVLWAASAQAKPQPKKPADDWLTISPAGNKPPPPPPPAAPPPAAPAAVENPAGNPPPAAAAPAKKKKTTPAPAPAPSGGDPAITAELNKAKKLFDAQEYDQVIPITKTVLEQPSLDIDQRLDAYLLQASSLAIVGSPVDAEKPFRFLLRGRPDFEMSADTSPKILAVFRKVQVEEKAIVDQLRELQRKRIIQALSFEGEQPSRGTGGQPILFKYTIRDPLAVVAEVSVSYRKQGEPAFSSLALKRDTTGQWLGEIPGAWTANPSGFTLEYFVRSNDGKDMELIDVASAKAPKTAYVEAGEVDEGGGPFYTTAWFWAAAGAVVAGSAVAGYLVYNSSGKLPETDLGELKLR